MSTTRGTILGGGAFAALVLAVSLRTLEAGTMYWSDPNAPFVIVRSDDGNPDSSAVHWCVGLIGNQPCGFCGWCHMSAADKANLKKFDRASDARHVQRYYPRLSSTLAEGQRLSFDNDRTFFTTERGQLVLYDRNKVRLLVAPAGSRVLKTPSGKPVTILFNGHPTIVKKSK